MLNNINIFTNSKQQPDRAVLKLKQTKGTPDQYQTRIMESWWFLPVTLCQYFVFITLRFHAGWKTGNFYLDGLSRKIFLLRRELFGSCRSLLGGVLLPEGGGGRVFLRETTIIPFLGQRANIMVAWVFPLYDEGGWSSSSDILIFPRILWKCLGPTEKIFILGHQICQMWVLWVVELHPS